MIKQLFSVVVSEEMGLHVCTIVPKDNPDERWVYDTGTLRYCWTIVSAVCIGEPPTLGEIKKALYTMGESLSYPCHAL